MRPVHRTAQALAILTVLLSGSLAGPARAKSPGDLEDLALVALAGEPGADEAVAALRPPPETGVEVVAPLLAAWNRCTAGACDGDRLDSGAALDTLDRVCGVRDCADLQLFWYTDLEAATATARREGKAVLSLRLMGRLDEELSCANSRFFRTAYYPDPAIAEVLRESYVLHWRSVAPVPKVTIDLGDGRRIERTVTGNSLHYVLDGHGRPVLALPGLMAPRTFRRALETVALHAAGPSTSLDDTSQWQWAREAWTLRLDQRRSTMTSAVRAIVDPGIETVYDTGSKATLETPLLRALREGELASPDNPMLVRLAERRKPTIQLSAESRSFVLAKHGGDLDRRQAEALIESFEATIALDEVIDLYRMEPAILEHLLAAERPIDLPELTDWIYREVFETPLDDPFLGLAPSDVYAALPSPTAARTAPSRVP